MKIDAFDVNLFSSRSYSETYFQEATHKFSFVDLMDLKLEDHQSPVRNPEGQGPEIFQADHGGSPWYQPIMVDGRPGVNLSDSFLSE